jgi:hypothetical protein
MIETGSAVCGLAVMETASAVYGHALTTRTLPRLIDQHISGWRAATFSGWRPSTLAVCTQCFPLGRTHRGRRQQLSVHSGLFWLRAFDSACFLLILLASFVVAQNENSWTLAPGMLIFCAGAPCSVQLMFYFLLPHVFLLAGV